MDIPVYLVAGFLDGGKTNFINGILEDGFARQDRTLLICCEEGEEEYNPRALDNVTVVTVDEEADLKCSWLKELEKKYRPKQVLIEYNGMWQMERLYREVLPANWVLYQIMTFVEASTFEMYAKNMGLQIARQPVAPDGGHTGGADIGDMAELLPAVRVGDMDLHGGDAHGLHRIQQRNAGVGVSGGVDDDAVYLVKVSLLDGVHQGALMVGLEKTHFHAQLVRFLTDHLLQVGVSGPTVDLRLADAQHVHVGAVNHQNVHKNLSK